jgi:hypothetical protein
VDASPQLLAWSFECAEQNVKARDLQAAVPGGACGFLMQGCLKGL